MKSLALPTLLAAALASLLVVVPFLPEVRSQSEAFALEARLTTSVAGHPQFYFDDGTGFHEEASGRANVVEAGRTETYRFPLPAGDYRAFRFDPLERAGTVTLESLRVVGRHGEVLRQLAPAALQPANQIAALRPAGEGLEIVTLPGATDAQLLLPLAPVLRLHSTPGQFLRDLLPPALAVFAAITAFLALLDRAPGLRARGAAAAAALAARPARAIAVVAAVAVVASAYPVVFLNRSYLSPNLGTNLLYDEFPTLPGYRTRTLVDPKGSDVGAIMWQHLPYGFLQQRALFRDGELPLFNRYNSAGSPLLDQGQSMSGDPLQLLVAAAGGGAWAWDLKFLVAKWLGATALGLLVLALTRHLPAALLTGLAAPFAGFFLYRLNHPAIFSFCYAPWVLYCWVRVGQAPDRRAMAGWLAGLVAANWMLLNSGTIKEAYMLLLTMNFSGACVLAAASLPGRERLRRFAWLGGAGIGFALLSAPVWLTFLDTLRTAYTSYNAVSAFQIQPGLLLGAFDELFYRPLTTGNRVFNPSASFVVLLGLLYFLATLRTHVSAPAVLALAASSLVPLAFAFGLVPASLVVRLPFLANVAHLDNSFSCALIVLWSVLAGVGFATAARRLGGPEGRGDLAIAGLLLGALAAAWIASLQAVHRSVFGPGQTVSFLGSSDQVRIPAFVGGSLVLLLATSVALGFLARRSLARRRLGTAGRLLAGLGVGLLLWRGALHAPSIGFEDFTARPGPRVDFQAASTAVAHVQSAQRSEPSRVVGLQGNLFPGWSGAYDLEGMSGPDALMNPFYRELTGASPVERLWDWRLYVSRENLAGARPFLDFLNVRYYLDLRSDQAALGTVLRLDRAADLDVYESPTAWPRAFFTDRLATYHQAADLVRLVTQGDGRPFAAVQVTEAGSAPALRRDLTGRTVEPARAYRLTMNTTSFDVRASGAGVVVLTETWWPGDIRAEVDGKAVPVLRLNHAFRGIAIASAGDHQVSFRYLPRRLPLAMVASGLGLAWLAAGFVLARRRSAIA
jgi:hypothetical protein